MSPRHGKSRILCHQQVTSRFVAASDPPRLRNGHLALGAALSVGGAEGRRQWRDVCDFAGSLVVGGQAPISVWAGRALVLREDKCPGRGAVRVGRKSGLSYRASILREWFPPGGRGSAAGEPRRVRQGVIRVRAWSAPRPEMCAARGGAMRSRSAVPRISHCFCGKRTSCVRLRGRVCSGWSNAGLRVGGGREGLGRGRWQIS